MKVICRSIFAAAGAFAVAALAGCGQHAPGVIAPGIGVIAGAAINADEGPFGGQSVNWYVAQLNAHLRPAESSDPAEKEFLWCNGRDAYSNATASVTDIQKRLATPSCQNIQTAASRAQGPYAGRDHAWFEAHAKERSLQMAWCKEMGKKPATGTACLVAMFAQPNS